MGPGMLLQVMAGHRVVVWVIYFFYRDRLWCLGIVWMLVHRTWCVAHRMWCVCIVCGAWRSVGNRSF